MADIGRSGFRLKYVSWRRFLLARFPRTYRLEPHDAMPKTERVRVGKGAATDQYSVQLCGIGDNDSPRAAARIVPFLRASYKASWSTTPPREVFMKTAFFFILPKVSLLYIFRVSGLRLVCGRGNGLLSYNNTLTVSYFWRRYKSAPRINLQRMISVRTV